MQTRQSQRCEWRSQDLSQSPALRSLQESRLVQRRMLTAVPRSANSYEGRFRFYPTLHHDHRNASVLRLGQLALQGLKRISLICLGVVSRKNGRDRVGELAGVLVVVTSVGDLGL